MTLGPRFLTYGNQQSQHGRPVKSAATVTTELNYLLLSVCMWVSGCWEMVLWITGQVESGDWTFSCEAALGLVQVTAIRLNPTEPSSLTLCQQCHLPTLLEDGTVGLLAVYFFNRNINNKHIDCYCLWYVCYYEYYIVVIVLTIIQWFF